MKKKITIIIALLITSFAFSQQIGDGYSPYMNDFNIPLKSGTYSGVDIIAGGIPDSSFGWQHLFAVRQGNPNYNYQLQIASSFSENDRLFFRKIGIASLSSGNSAWIELATRGVNTFSGDQIINGKVGIGTTTPSAFLEVYSPNIEVGKNDTQKWSSRHSDYYLKLQTIWNENGINQEFVQRFAGVDHKSLSFFCGNVGIGTSTPDSKLAVNGTIHSKEVKVDMTGWSDFVFKKEYKLPTLAEVEKHINEKGHLENIPTEAEVLKNGINLGEMNAKLLQKIEELTLYMIDMKKENAELKKENTEMNKRLTKLENK